MLLSFNTVMRLTMDEGRAAKMMGFPDDLCPYRIGEHSRDMELRGYWMAGYAQGVSVVNVLTGETRAK